MLKSFGFKTEEEYLMDKEKVLELVRNKNENDICDFKCRYYHENKKYDLIKDIASFANCTISLDKYIIFNIDDDTRNIGQMDENTIPDISEINSLLREYVEPHLLIELNKFTSQESWIAYLKISANNMDKPYVIKKDFIRESKTFLAQGQVYIRRNATNHKANRHDLDEIYESREKCEIKLYDEKITVKEVCINNLKTIFYTLRFIIKNDSKYNFLLQAAVVQFSSQAHSFIAKGKYIEDEKQFFSTSLNDIKTVPFSVLANTTTQKTLYFSVSEQGTNRLKENLSKEQPHTIKLTTTDTNGKTIQTDKIPCIIQYDC